MSSLLGRQNPSKNHPVKAASTSNSSMERAMIDEYLTTQIAVHAMGWRVAAGRYLKADRSWASRAGFRPFADLNDAFRALRTVTQDYSLRATSVGVRVDVRLGDRTAHAVDSSEARAICLALAEVLGIRVEDYGDGHNSGR